MICTYIDITDAAGGKNGWLTKVHPGELQLEVA